jgi:hypothetical protein
MRKLIALAAADMMRSKIGPCNLMLIILPEMSVKLAILRVLIFQLAFLVAGTLRNVSEIHLEFF